MKATLCSGKPQLGEADWVGTFKLKYLYSKLNIFKQTNLVGTQDNGLKWALFGICNL